MKPRDYKLGFALCGTIVVTCLFIMHELDKYDRVEDATFKLEKLYGWHALEVQRQEVEREMAATRAKIDYDLRLKGLK